jgi:hypothetical protein
MREVGSLLGFCCGYITSQFFNRFFNSEQVINLISYIKFFNLMKSHIRKIIEISINTFSHFNILNSNLEKVREYKLSSYIYFVHVIIDNL